MKRSTWKRSAAVTLFEMLLVLFVSSMVAISTFKYQQQTRESDVANPLSEKMFLYAQTVRTFVVSNQTEIAAGTLNPFAPPLALPAGSTFTMTGTGANVTYKITGISWLQTLKPEGSTVSYLPKTFTFNALNPLELRRGNLKGDDAIAVEITTTRVTITFGALYEISGEQKLQGSVTAMAAAKANKLYDPLLGVSSFNYVGGVDKNGAVVPITAVWDKAQSEQTHLNTDTDVGGNLAVSGDVNLKADGTAAGNGTPGEPGDNSADLTGVGTLAFDQAINSAVFNLDQINFSLHGHRTDSNGDSVPGGQIDNLGDLYMVGDASISGVNDITFDTSGGTSAGSGNDVTGLQNITFAPGTDTNITFPIQGGKVDNVGTINFVSSGKINNIDTISFSANGAGAITGLKTINFASGRKFEGFGTPVVWSRCADTNDCNQSASALVATGYSATKNVCALNLVRFHDGNNDNQRGCTLTINAGNMYVMVYENALRCGMICHPYSQ